MQSCHDQSVFSQVGSTQLTSFLARGCSEENRVQKTFNILRHVSMHALVLEWFYCLKWDSLQCILGEFLDTCYFSGLKA